MPDPAISVLIPTYGRPDGIARCLEGLCGLATRGGFEVVVVDDGSPVPVPPIAERFAGRLDLRCVRQENAGPAAARNRAAAEARAPLLALTDDDCLPEEGWLDALQDALVGAPDAVVGGRTVNAVTGNVYAQAAQDIVTLAYDAAKRSGEHGFFTSNNLACSAETYAGLGGFDERFPLAAGEDRDFGLRAKAAGHALVYAAEAVVRHEHAMDLRGFWRQQRAYGRGAYQLRKRAAEASTGGVGFEAFGFYRDIVLGPLRDGAPRPLTRASLGALSQAAVAAGYAREALAGRKARD